MNSKSRTPKLALILGSLTIDSILVLGDRNRRVFLRFGRTEGPFPRPNFADFLKIILPIIVLRLLCFFIYGLLR